MKIFNSVAHIIRLNVGYDTVMKLSFLRNGVLGSYHVMPSFLSPFWDVIVQAERSCARHATLHTAPTSFNCPFKLRCFGVFDKKKIFVC